MLAMWHDEKWPPGDPGVPACRVVKTFAHGRKSWDLALKLREKRRQQPEIIKKKRVDMVYQTKNAEHQRGRFLLGGKPSKDQRLSVLFGQCSDPFWLHHLFLGGFNQWGCYTVRWSWEDGEHDQQNWRLFIQKSSRNSMDCFILHMVNW